jgi:hypothetical protein
VDDDLLTGLRALADPLRLRLVARLLEAPADAATLAQAVGLPVAAVRKPLGVLTEAGLVQSGGGAPGTWVARPDRIGQLGRGLARLQRAEGGGVAVPAGAWPHDGESLAETLARLSPTPEEARTLRAFLVDGRLVSIPAQPRRRDVVLRFLLERVFTEDREYPEKEVNQRLALFHPDVASLRRYLVDEGYVTRQASRYRRRTTRPSSA